MKHPFANRSTGTSPPKLLSLSLLVPTAACHSILSTNDLKFAKTPNALYEYSLVMAPEAPAEEDAAILYCTHVRDEAHANAHRMEVAGFIIGPIGFIGATTGTAIAAKASNMTNVAIATGTGPANSAIVETSHRNDDSRGDAELVVHPPPRATVGQVRWQTCAKILATWEASKGAADAAMAGIFGSKPGGGGAGGGGNASGDGGSGKKGN